MTDRVTVRDGRVDDGPLLAGFDPVASRGEPGRTAEIKRSLASGVVRVAQTAGRPIGYCVTEPTFFGEPFVELLIVAEAARRQGVGRLLLDDAVERCSGKKIFTSTNLSNTAMSRLLAAVGWDSAGIVYGLDAGDPELIFMRRLRV